MRQKSLNYKRFPEMGLHINPDTSRNRKWKVSVGYRLSKMENEVNWISLILIANNDLELRIYLNDTLNSFLNTTHLANIVNINWQEILRYDKLMNCISIKVQLSDFNKVIAPLLERLCSIKMIKKVMCEDFFVSHTLMSAITSPYKLQQNFLLSYFFSLIAAYGYGLKQYYAEDWGDTDHNFLEAFERVVYLDDELLNQSSSPINSLGNLHNTSHQFNERALSKYATVLKEKNKQFFNQIHNSHSSFFTTCETQLIDRTPLSYHPGAIIKYSPSLFLGSLKKSEVPQEQLSGKRKSYPDMEESERSAKKLSI